MTLEHKIVVGLDDIKAVSFECKQCQTKVTISPDNIRVPHHCQQCDSVWILGEPSNYLSVSSPYMNFVNAIGQIRKQLANGAPFKILLEFSEEIPKGNK
jgi:hypothetical protein